MPLVDPVIQLNQYLLNKMRHVRFCPNSFPHVTFATPPEESPYVQWDHPLGLSDAPVVLTQKFRGDFCIDDATRYPKGLHGNAWWLSSMVGTMSRRTRIRFAGNTGDWKRCRSC